MTSGLRVAILAFLCTFSVWIARVPMTIRHGDTNYGSPLGGGLNARPFYSAKKPFAEILDKIEETLQEVDERPATEPFSRPLHAAQILEAVQQSLRHALTSPELANTREFYGPPGDPTVVLVDDGDVSWPAGLRLQLDGFRLKFGPANNVPSDQDHVLGIHLSKLDVAGPPRRIIWDGNIQLTMSNVGGGRNGMVIGSSMIWYVVTPVDGWVEVSFGGSLDP